MNIICPECGKSHRLPDDRLPNRKSAAKCKKCDARMIINPQPSSTDTSEINRGVATIGQDESEPREFDILLTDSYDENPEGEPLPPLDAEGSEATGKRDNYAEGTTAAGDEIHAAFPELQELSPEKFVYEEIFSTTERHGYRTRENTLKLKIVKAVHDILTTKVLYEDEQVMRLAKGIAYYPFEIPYANGLLTLLSNYFAIVCTNRRLLLVNIDSRINRPTRYIFQVPYGEISNIGRGAFLSSLIIESKTGRSWNFTTVKRNLAKSLRDFILGKSKEEPAGLSDGNSRWQLCPACYTPLPGGLASCPHCSVAFKKPTEAMIRSLVLPGLGSIYLSYLPLGIMEMAGYLAIWLLAVLLLIVKVPGGLVTAIAPVLTYHLVTGLLARKTAGKGYLPENNPVTPPVESDKNHEDLSQEP